MKPIMKASRYSLLIILLCLIASTGWSQQKQAKIEINYVAGIPTGNFKTLTDKVSGRGVEASLLFGVTDQFQLGLQTGFQDFYQKYPRQLFEESGYTLSAVISNSVQVTPLMLKGRYMFASTGTLRPYVSLAAGANLISYTKYYGQFADSKTKIGFAAQPELGLQIPVGAAKRTAFNIAAGYDYMPFNFNDADGLHHVNLKAGVSIPLK
jgi:hypothetical protein